jgi:Fic family protein
MLGQADSGQPEGLEAWCVYVLQGMMNELRKVDQLTDTNYLNERILVPALNYARQRELLTAQETQVLLAVARIGVVKASDLKDAMPGLNEAQRTYQIRKLVERKMLSPIREGSRQYTIGFSNNYLIRGVIRALSAEGFIPESMNHPG